MPSHRSNILATMQGRVLRWAVPVILAAMLGGHATELFDRWDHTLRTGKDADYAVVMVAACAGLAFAAAKLLSAFFSVSRVRESVSPAPFCSPFLRICGQVCATGPSPPLPVSLRI